MKNARDRAEEFLRRYLSEYTIGDVRRIEILLKEQDKITRHACAEACIEHADAPAICMIDRCHNSCMNVKAV
jgi:hypothetical protein